VLSEVIGGLNQLLARTRKSGAVVSKEAPQVVADTGRMADASQGVFQCCDRDRSSATLVLLVLGRRRGSCGGVGKAIAAEEARCTSPRKPPAMAA
jgi:hypothetical protein